MVFVSASSPSSTLVLIDSAIQGYQSLINHVHPEVKVVVVDPTDDGIAQITRILAGCSSIRSLHLLSHGSPAALNLGSSRLNWANFDRYVKQIRTWSKALTDDAELWLYGCSVASGDMGRAFVETIANLTGASIAASSTPIGNAALGGNWQFDHQIGTIHAASPFDQAVLQAYPFVFGTLDWSVIGWPAGFVGEQPPYTNLNNTGVNITIKTAADPGLIFGSNNGELTPNDTAYYQGGKPVAPEAFHFTINPTPIAPSTVSKGQGVTLTVKFNQPLTNVFFEIFDIDKASNWQDEVTVTGFNGATTVLPTFTPSASPTYSITSNVLQGTGDSTNTGANSARGTAGVRFNNPITEFTIVFRDGPLAADDPGEHGIALLSNITFDDPMVIVRPISGNTTEAGGTATFEVVLNTVPISNVTVNLASSDTTEGTVPASIIFTPANWNIPQTVLVTGEDDFIVDGDIPYTIVTSVTTSDPQYVTIDPLDVPVINVDNDTPASVAGITVSKTTLTTSEALTSDSFTVVLNSQPTADVTVTLTGLDPTEGTLSKTELIFTVANWKTPQTVTVTGANDDEVDGNIPYNLVATATSDDTNYNAIAVSDVTVTNIDNDASGVTVTPTQVTTTETGGSGSFDVVLNTQPASDVTINLTGVDISEGNLSTTTLTFTPANWSTLQTVKVTGLDDTLDDGDISHTINTSASSKDINYNNISVPDVTVTNQDNDAPVIGTPGLTVSPISGNTTEAGGTATFTIQLNSVPTADVVVNLISSDLTEGSVPGSVTFTSTNWNVPQTVTVTGVDDLIVDGNIPYIILTSITTTDISYQEINPNDVSVINLDNDQNPSKPVTPPASKNNNPPSPVIPTPGIPSEDDPEVCLPGLTLRGNRQKNQLNGTFKGDSIRGLKGNDVLHGKGCNDLVMGGRGKDRLFGDQGHDRVMGEAGNDRLNGNDGDDILTGGRGKDQIRGGANDDVLRGQQKRDILNGGQGSDRIWGHLGRDMLRGGQGDDRMEGGRGHDRLFGGKGNDQSNGGLNHDRINGFAGDDLLWGQRGKDTLRGHRGHDILNGGQHRDRLRGHQGSDILRGGAGRDRLNGGAGDDILVGGGRRDRLTGGTGEDRFVYQNLKARGDLIKDFDPSEDRIDLRQIAAQSRFQDRKTVSDFVQLTQVGSHTRVQFDINGNALGGLRTLATLENVATTDLNDRNFLI